MSRGLMYAREWMMKDVKMVHVVLSMLGILRVS